MHGPAMSGWLLVVLSTATGAYCLARMRSDSETARTSAGGEALMGFGMAVMALPAAVVTLPAWGWTVLAVVFGCGALRALWSARTAAHHLHHLVGTLAMVYMAVPMASGGMRTGHMEQAAGGVPLITGVLLAYYAGYVLRTGATLIPVPTPVAAGGTAGPTGGAAGAAAPGWGARPELTLACRLSMGIAMFAMLLTL
ncbi:DUF5134 domain-containing protein [Streptomyces sp. NPDC051320]|uniref:DUF5134 domain-containing protein n=1 Tax=Streptomyces sp. NPDC051320 TaxID=3154644 RepID=UPI00342813B5